MDTVTITSTQNISLDDLQHSIAVYWPIKRAEDRLVVEGPKTRVYIYHPLLGDGHRDPKQIHLDYHSVDLVKRIVEVIGDNPELLIENDFGTALPGDQFVARLRSYRDWEWRV